jgi:Flp pilus assembly protein TadD
VKKRTIGILGLGLMAAGMLGAAGGCARSNGKTEVQAGPYCSDAFFAAGANRAPTLKTRYAVARLLSSQGKDEQAIFVLTHIIRECPQCLPAYNDLAEIYIRHRRFDQADAVLASGLRIAQERDPVLLNNRGMCCMITGKFEAALEAFSAASAVAPSDARFQANRATALGMLGRYDEALEQYYRVLAPADAHFNLAVICEAHNDKERAQEEFHRANGLKVAAVQEEQK